MSDEAGKYEDQHDAQMTADDPMMKRAEMMVTGGDVRSLGEPEPPGVVGSGDAEGTSDTESEPEASS